MKRLVTFVNAVGVLLSVSTPAWAQEKVSFKQQLDNWLPGMSAERIPDRRQSQQALQEALIKLGAPGREAELAAACKAVAEKIGPETAKPARVWMLKQLEFNGGVECVAAVAVLLRDEDPQIRDCARRALQNNPAPEANAKLLEGLAAAVDDVQRVAIINALGSRVDPSSAGAVARLLTHDNLTVAAAAANALGKIGEPQTVAALTNDNITTNTIGMKLKLIQPGSFMMGSTGDYDNEMPVHKVTLTKPFYLGVYEVTQEQYERVMGTNPSNLKESNLLPVEMVSWEDVVEFCRKLSAMEGLEYRLPTEAEWEYACRAGTTTSYSMGVTISTDQANYNGNYIYGRGVKGVYRCKTMEVGSFAPNAWGLYEMHGNVWEWCLDWFGSDYYKTSPERNPTGPASGTYRVLRGGGWNSHPRHLCSAFRLDGHPPDYRSSLSSFRVVREAAAVLNTALEQAKLTAADAAAGDRFGWSVSMDGDYAVVGAYNDDDRGTNSGAAYIFKRDGTTWTQQAKFTAADAAAEDQFGWSVCLNGDYAVVGANCDDDLGNNSGSAYIFKRVGTTWSQAAKLTATDVAAGDRFGFSVSINGDYALAGAFQNDDHGTDSGSAYIFKRNGTTWSQQAYQPGGK